MSSASAPLLVAVDLQEVFAQETSPWATPRFSEILGAVDELVACFPDAVFTRFVAPDEPEGAWADYYARWPFAQVPPGDPIYRLVDRYGAQAPRTVSATTFSKWEALRAAVAPGRVVVLCGVSTDCCVLATALAAADAGVRVRVVAEACAGLDDDAHRRALALMALFSPLIEVISLAEARELAGAQGAA